MISPVAASLAPALAAIHAQSFTGADVWNAESLVALLTSPGVFGLVHEAGGFMLLRAAHDEADILTLAVAPSARRRGVASALLAAAFAEARGQGIAQIFLEVAEHNHPAIALYRKHGFTQAGRRPNYYTAGAAALVLRLSLA
jgi:ribosomal-protein-alanine N-acetyltransferase